MKDLLGFRDRDVLRAAVMRVVPTWKPWERLTGSRREVAVRLVENRYPGFQVREIYVVPTRLDGIPIWFAGGRGKFDRLFRVELEDGRTVHVDPKECV